MGIAALPLLLASGDTADAKKYEGDDEIDNDPITVVDLFDNEEQVSQTYFWCAGNSVAKRHISLIESVQTINEIEIDHE